LVARQPAVVAIRDTVSVAQLDAPLLRIGAHEALRVLRGVEEGVMALPAGHTERTVRLRLLEAGAGHTVHLLIEGAEQVERNRVCAEAVHTDGCGDAAAGVAATEEIE